MKSLVEQQKINFKHLAMRVFDADRLVLSQSTPYQVIAEFKQTRVRFMLLKTNVTKSHWYLQLLLPSTWIFMIYIHTAL
jgi:hypothetical protein